MTGDTISTPDVAQASRDKKIRRQVKTVRPWEYRAPVRFMCSRPEMAESLVCVLRGRVGVLLFHSEGKLVQPIRLGGNGEKREIKIPSGTFYSLITLADESAVVEVQPTHLSGVSVQWLKHSPKENTPEAKDAWRRWVSFFQK